MIESFSFGKNWQAFIQNYFSKSRVQQAQKSLRQFLELKNIKGKVFLDIGCGSGIFSYAAHRLGAKKVVSFDLDPFAAKCTSFLWKRAGKPSNWQIYQGSILDKTFIKTLNQADIVYAWGVLHHTGKMWQAIRNAASLVKPGGLFFISIYNKEDKFFGSRFWLRVKQFYNASPWSVKLVLEWLFMLASIANLLAHFKNPIYEIKNYQTNRGMSWRIDISDWLGGIPLRWLVLKK